MSLDCDMTMARDTLDFTKPHLLRNDHELELATYLDIPIGLLIR